MNRVANKVFDYMVLQEVNTEEMREEYVYSLEVLMGKLLSYGTLLLIAVLFNILVPAIVFMITFYPLRSRSGGYHSKTFLGCYLGTICIYILLILVVIPYITGKLTVLVIIMAVAAVAILLFSPVDHPNLLLSEVEKDTCRKSSIWLLFLIVICTGIAMVANINPIIASAAVAGIGMDAGLILIAKLCRQDVKETEKNV